MNRLGLKLLPVVAIAALVAVVAILRHPQAPSVVPPAGKPPATKPTDAPSQALPKAEPQGRAPAETPAAPAAGTSAAPNLPGPQAWSFPAEIRRRIEMDKSPKERLRAILALARDARRNARSLDGPDGDLSPFFRREDHPVLREGLLECEDDAGRGLVLRLLRDLGALDEVEDVLIRWSRTRIHSSQAIPMLARLRSAGAASAIEQLLASELPSDLPPEERRDRLTERDQLVRELGRQGRTEFRPLILSTVQRAEERGEGDFSLLSCRAALARMGDGPSQEWIRASLDRQTQRGVETDWTFVTVAIRHLGLVGTRTAGSDVLAFLTRMAPVVSPEILQSLLGHAEDVLGEIAGRKPPPTSGTPAEGLSVLKEWWATVR
jgi:hypothetical protein